MAASTLAVANFPSSTLSAFLYAARFLFSLTL